MVRATVPEEQPPAPGSYPGLVEQVLPKESDTYGEFWAWRFSIMAAEGPVEVSGASSPKLGSQTKARKWVEAIIGRQLQPREDFDLDNLAGRACIVVIDVNDKGFGKVTDVLPPLKRGLVPTTDTLF